MCLAGGYGIDGYLDATGVNSGYDELIPQSQYYLSLDIDDRKIPMKSGFWKSLLYAISFIKIPAPTLKFNQLSGGTNFYWIYF